MHLSWHGRARAAAAVAIALGVGVLVLPGAALAAGPDIVVQSITTDPAIPAVGQQFTVTVVAKNQGDASSGSFLNRIYVNPADQPPTDTTAAAAQCSIFMLAAGGTGSCSVANDPDLSVPTAGCDHTLWVWADATNMVAESIESNNVLSQTLCVGVECQTDAFEDDDTCAAAGFITNTIGIGQPHTFCPTADDEDWLKFSAVAGITYTVEAVATGAHAQPVVQLLNGCGSPPQFGSGPSFTWIAPATGLYYLRVTDDDPEDGPLTGYTLAVRAEGGGGNDIYEPDNTCATARDIQPGAAYSQTHYFETQGDQDWVKWPVEAGATYVLVADQAASGVSPQVTLFSSCAQSFGGGGTPGGASATFDAAEAGMLYARVANADPNVYGGAASYRLTLNMVACASDAFEEDDGPAQAKTIVAGAAPGARNVCPAGDQDWVKFTAVAGTAYLLETSDLGPDADTELTLYGPNATTVLAQNDDYTPGLLNSRIVWQAPAAGTYYAMVKHVKATAAGASTRYALSLSEGSCTPDTADRSGGDNSPQRAVPIGTTGSPLTRNFCPLGDQDWFSFEASKAGTAVTVRTSGLGYDSDTVIDLIGPNGVTVLASNDDYTVGQASYITTTVPAPGRYYVRVTHYNSNHFGGGTNYQLSVWTQNPPPPTPSPTPLPTPVPTATPVAVPSDVRTVILVNRSRVEAQYEPTQANDLMAKLYALAAHQRVKGAVLQVEQDPSVAAAYNAWTQTPQSLLETAKANAVAAAVRGLGLAFIASNPSVEHIVIVGDDRIIPFRRVPDHTGKPESHYAGAVTPNTTQWAAFQDDMSLTDACYADLVPSTWSKGEYCLPDYGIGRLIETPTQIMAFIDSFLASDGMTGSTALITGYSFVTDAASLIKSLFQADGLTTNYSLVGETWSADTLRSIQLGSTRYDLQSVNGHATHSRQIAPDNSSVTAADIVSSTTDLAGAIVFTVGCHSGFNDSGTLDLAQAFSRKGANYVANTGYGWGGGGVTYSEALMRNFALELLKGTSTEIGPALTRAKARYVQQTLSIGSYDEKILVESTLYGLPMYRLVTSGAFQDEDPFPSAAVANTPPSGAFGTLSAGNLTCSLPGSFGAFDDTPEAPESYYGDGSYFALDHNVSVAAGEPIQPRFFAEISAPSAGTLRGVLFLGGVYTDVAGFDPVVAQPFNEYVTPGPEPAFSAPGWYPPVPFSVQNGDTSLATADSLVVLMGQFDAGTDTERLYDHLSFDTYYSSDPDHEPPTIDYVNGLLDPARGKGVIKVGASDPSDVVRVVVAYTENQGEWLSNDLAYDQATLKWGGEITATTQTRFIVQAVDGAGNVQVAQNKGAYYRLLPPAPLASDGTSRLSLPLVVRNPAP